MSRRLRDNVSSAYFSAANRLNSAHSRRRIVAYVESYDDVFFWRNVLSGFEDDTRYFEVMLPTRLNLTKGKKSVLMNMLTGKTGQDMIACVDADYDYMLQGVTKVSREIISDPYVLHTYVYAIENYQCYGPSLHDVCVAVALNDHALFDFDGFLCAYSQIIYPLFVWNIWYYRRGWHSRFTISDFNRIIETGAVNIRHPELALDNVAHKVDRAVKALNSKNHDQLQSYEDLKKELEALGLHPDNTYLFIQGHHLFDNVVVPILKKVCDTLIRERQNEIHRKAVHHTQMSNELASYNHSIEEITPMLRRNLGYTRSEPYKRLLADVERLLSSASKTQE